jgi:hypothetical protein
MGLFKMLFTVISVFSISFSAHAAYEFQCEYKGDVERDQPYYGKSITLVVGSANAYLKGEDMDEGDSGTLSGNYKKYPRPRFFGFDNHADCASGNYMEVDAQILKGQPGEVEFTGPGNEDCGAGDDTYLCK